jgi:MAPEG family
MAQSFVTAANPAFLAYVFTCLVLSLNLLMLWVSSGALRAKGGVAINPEDGARYGAPVSELDPPAVARLLRAHRNAVFIAARIVHSIVYLKAMQPWRTIAFAISLLAILALIAAVLHVLLTA